MARRGSSGKISLRGHPRLGIGRGWARPQVFSNLGQGGRSFYQVAELGGFPANLGLSLKFREPSG